MPVVLPAFFCVLSIVVASIRFKDSVSKSANP